MLYQKKEENGKEIFEPIDTEPSAWTRQMIADYKYIAENVLPEQVDTIVELLRIVSQTRP